ncbi:hypothetical protein QJS10_CPA01g02555 [Acorus calamus]|uniref:Reverse transcriptase zinc-binding domain-containing protein n=1 Tax=Acorus calamus TaxID=4465 RepID=A0AAV9FLY4_ACOCL|nr:hypothetical protein QJS10_CPA01g02555 [Acorus calamus]
MSPGEVHRHDCAPRRSTQIREPYQRSVQRWDAFPGTSKLSEFGGRRGIGFVPSIIAHERSEYLSPIMLKCLTWNIQGLHDPQNNVRLQRLSERRGWRLPRTTSDHSPILLVSKPPGRNKHIFRFESWWLECEGFETLIRQSWNSGAGILRGARCIAFKLRRLKQCLKRWGRLERLRRTEEKSKCEIRIAEIDRLEESQGWFTGMEQFVRACVWDAGDGGDILFWTDRWCGEEAFESRFPQMFHISSNPEGRACMYWERRAQSGAWRIQFVRQPTPSEATQASELVRILAGAPLALGIPDKVCWGRTSREGYTVRRGYLWWRRLAPHSQEMVTHRGIIWDSAVPLKVKFFVWLVCHGRILTKAYVSKWCPNISTVCVLCNANTETVDHLFRECSMARELWERLGSLCHIRLTWASLDEFWSASRRMANQGDRRMEAKVRRLVVPAGLWAIWLTRNAVVFRGQRFYRENLWEATEGFIRDWGRYIVGTTCIELHRGGAP